MSKRLYTKADSYEYWAVEWQDGDHHATAGHAETYIPNGNNFCIYKVWKGISSDALVGRFETKQQLYSVLKLLIEGFSDD